MSAQHLDSSSWTFTASSSWTYAASSSWTFLPAAGNAVLDSSSWT